MTAITRSIDEYCTAHAHQHVDPSTGEVNFTSLAEACAHALGHDEWLDEENHDVWDSALDAAESYDRMMHS